MIEISQDIEPGIYDVDVADVLGEYLEKASRRGRGLFKGGNKLVSIFGR